IREGLPEHHAQDLTRIEQGIGSLAQRIAALGRESERAREGVALSPLPTAPPADDDPSDDDPCDDDPWDDDPWDRQSAEELMRVYEAVSAAPVAPSSRAGPHPRPCSSREPALPAAPEPPHRDAAWLEARFAQIAALIQIALANANPAPALASLDRRLDRFERGLEDALAGLAPAAGRGDLKLIDAHLVEFAGQVAAVRQQLNRLDTIDAQLRELAHAIERGAARAGQSALNEDAVAQLIASAAERAASKVAQCLPALDEQRVDTLEALVRGHIAERRQNEEASAGLLHSIEDTLVRIVDRVEAMEATRPAPYAHGTLRDCDGLQSEDDRLAEVYAEGARVLGQPGLPPTLDAADYVAADRQQQRATANNLTTEPGADDWARQDEMARQKPRASVLRAKLKAQALALAPLNDVAPEKGAPDPLAPEPLRPDPLTPDPLTPDPLTSEPLTPEPLRQELLRQELLGQGRVRTWAFTKTGSYRASLLLGVGMALLVGASFVAVDAMLAAPPHAAAQGQESVPQPGSRAGNGKISPEPNADHPQAAPRAQPTPHQRLPDGTSEDAGRSEPAPTPRLQRLQRGTASVPPGRRDAFHIAAAHSRRCFIGWGCE
ncbi:MAG: hypothetical protein J2P51_08145, partial [Hyphomicrobiaceae bacterium]|nr:hypothetical protein [Hyphomicrobiaceae bacterium]